MTGIL
jgi:hypothetical protein